MSLILPSPGLHLLQCHAHSTFAVIVLFSFLPLSLSVLTIMKIGDVRRWNWSGTPLPANRTLRKPRLLKDIRSLNNTHGHTQASTDIKSTVIGVSPIKIDEKEGIHSETEEGDRPTKTATKRKRDRQKERGEEKKSIGCWDRVGTACSAPDLLVGLCKLYPLRGKICGGWTGEDPLLFFFSSVCCHLFFFRSAPSIFQAPFKVLLSFASCRLPYLALNIHSSVSLSFFFSLSVAP